jgi:hypothetical protein
MLRRILCLGLLAVAFTAAPASAQYGDVQGTVEDNVVSGDGCEPGSTVDFTLLTTGGQQVANLGSTTAGGDGTFSATVSPAGVPAGSYQLIISCGDSTTSIPVQVSSSGLAPGQTTQPTTPVGAGVTTGSGLARTGTDSGQLVRGAAVLIAVGGLLLVGTRRRRITPA